MLSTNPLGSAKAAVGTTSSAKKNIPARRRRIGLEMYVAPRLGTSGEEGECRARNAEFRLKKDPADGGRAAFALRSAFCVLTFLLVSLRRLLAQVLLADGGGEVDIGDVGQGAEPGEDV